MEEVVPSYFISMAFYDTYIGYLFLAISYIPKIIRFIVARSPSTRCRTRALHCTKADPQTPWSISVKARPLLRLPSKRIERSLSLDIPTRKSSIDFHVACSNNPLLLVDVPIAEIASHERKVHSLALARLQEDFFETSEDLDGCYIFVGRLWETKV